VLGNKNGGEIAFTNFSYYSGWSPRVQVRYMPSVCEFDNLLSPCFVLCWEYYYSVYVQVLNAEGFMIGPVI